MKKLDLKEICKKIEIDWSVPQWVISSDGECLVLTTGGHNGSSFNGMAMPCECYPLGDYSTGWTKNDFRYFTGSINLTISNND